MSTTIIHARGGEFHDQENFAHLHFCKSYVTHYIYMCVCILNQELQHHVTWSGSFEWGWGFPHIEKNVTWSGYKCLPHLTSS
jgi:hypothetical protein